MKLFLISLLSFSLVSCGGSGHIMLYNFNAPKYDVHKEILDVINKDSTYTVPKKWIEVAKEAKEAGDGLEYFFLYFKHKPEEMYEMQFADSASWNNSLKSSLGLNSRFDGHFWKYGKDLSSKENERITKRFEDEILSKLKYGFEKSYY